MATTAQRRRRKHWGWGYEDEQPPHDEVRAAAAAMAPVLGFGDAEPERPVPLEDVELSAPRLDPPAVLEEICRTDTYERAAHAYGKSYRDVVRADDGGAGGGEVEVLARSRDWTRLAGKLAGWRDVCGRRDSLAWLRERLGGVGPPAGGAAASA